MYKLIPIVNESLGGHYENIGKRADYISELIHSEETQFLRTVQSGLKLFHQVVADLKSKKETNISGETAFKLYDTYGFPLDLTQVMALENKMTVNSEVFKKELNNQRQRSRSARKEELNDGKDAQIEAIGSFVGDVQPGIYIDHPGGGEARIPVTSSQRFGIAQHHTGTHLLHEALRKVLGPQVQQAGSLVDVNRLRFDFTYGKSVTSEELLKITNYVNTWVKESHPVIVTNEPISKAKEKGAHAMFGEKYGQVVRVVTIPKISIELCGGNHVSNTQELQTFKIVSESAVAAGTRRIEAILGEERIIMYDKERRDIAFKEYEKRWALLDQKSISIELEIPKKINENSNIELIQTELNKLIKLSKHIEKEVRRNQQGKANELVNSLMNEKRILKAMDGNCVFQFIENQPMPILKDLADQLVEKMGKGAVLLASKKDQNGIAIAKISDSLIQAISAKDLINEFTSITNGGGGGRDQMAQAGGIDPTKINDGITHIIKKYAK